MLADFYSKRLNLIVHGLPESEAWETREKSLSIVHDFLTDKLKIDKDVIIIDAHRMKTRTTEESRITRGLLEDRRRRENI